jgi:hypothetical protein
MTIRKEFGFTLAIAFVVAVSLALLVTLFSSASSDHEEILTYLRAADERLEALEHNRAKATAKRFTSDDAQDLLLCVRLPHAERGPCLDRFQARFKTEP